MKRNMFLCRSSIVEFVFKDILKQCDVRTSLFVTFLKVAAGCWRAYEI